MLKTSVILQGCTCLLYLGSPHYNLSVSGNQITNLVLRSSTYATAANILFKSMAQ